MFPAATFNKANIVCRDHAPRRFDCRDHLSLGTALKRSAQRSRRCWVGSKFSVFSVTLRVKPLIRSLFIVTQKSRDCQTNKRIFLQLFLYNFAFFSANRTATRNIRSPVYVTKRRCNCKGGDMNGEVCRKAASEVRLRRVKLCLLTVKFCNCTAKLRSK